MNAYQFMLTALVLFGIAALGGLVMAGICFSGQPRPPSWLAMLHGVLAAAGLTLLIYAAFTVGLPLMAEISVAVLVVAALGGAGINLLYHSKMLPLPKGFIVVHALLAIAGFVLLLVSVMAPSPAG